MPYDVDIIENMPHFVDGVYPDPGNFACLQTIIDGPSSAND
jgi:hypothetical protein